MGNWEPIARDDFLKELRELLGAYSMRKRSSMARSSWSAMILARSLSGSVEARCPLPSFVSVRKDRTPRSDDPATLQPRTGDEFRLPH
jgi:hypothetical protein